MAVKKKGGGILLIPKGRGLSFSCPPPLKGRPLMAAKGTDSADDAGGDGELLWHLTKR